MLAENLFVTIQNGPHHLFGNCLPAVSSQPSHKAPPKNKRQAENLNCAGCSIWTAPHPPNTASLLLIRDVCVRDVMSWILARMMTSERWRWWGGWRCWNPPPPASSVSFAEALLYVHAPLEVQGQRSRCTFPPMNVTSQPAWEWLMITRWMLAS